VTLGSSDGASGAKMRVDGLGCPMCAESISILMDNVDGVTESRVDLSNGIVDVALDTSVDVRGEDLRRAIDDGGFTFRSIEFVK
jgi:copper chaperone CopZ